MSNRIPEKIGKYRILGIAGRGAMGEVYIGHDPFIDRNVAIKVASFEDEADGAAQRARKMFFNEAQAAGVLDHPNILHVYDAGELEGGAYIVMEYVEGARTLKAHITPDSLLPIPQVVRLIQRCASALDYAHRRGVTHRDIKPANIMLTQDGEPKIGDFGIAQRAYSDMTQVMGVFGSPRYMSPEQVQEEAPNNQTDLYSLGVVLYELLTGRPPFKASGLPALVRKILHEQPEPLRELRPEVSEDLAAIVAKAMCKQRNERYRTGGELAADLTRVLEDVERPAAEPSEQQKFEALRELKFFNDFSDDELRETLEASTWETVRDGERIIVEGTSDHAFYVIVSGDVAVTIADKTIEVLGKGECIGEIGYLSKAQRTATVTAIGAVTLLKVDSDLMEWASIPCQLRFNKVFQRVLIDRLTKTSLELSKRLQ